MTLKAIRKRRTDKAQVTKNEVNSVPAHVQFSSLFIPLKNDGAELSDMMMFGRLASFFSTRELKWHLTPFIADLVFSAEALERFNAHDYLTSLTPTLPLLFAIEAERGAANKSFFEISQSVRDSLVAFELCLSKRKTEVWQESGLSPSDEEIKPSSISAAVVYSEIDKAFVSCALDQTRDLISVLSTYAVEDEMKFEHMMKELKKIEDWGAFKELKIGEEGLAEKRRYAH